MSDTTRSAGHDLFKALSREFREIAAAPASEAGLARIREGLASKYQGVQHLAARALGAWIERARPLKPRQKRWPRRRLRPDGIPEGPVAEWIALLVDWIVLLPVGWWQSVFFSARLVARLARPEDAAWIIDLYLTMDRTFVRAVYVLPPELCVPRLQELAVSSTNADDRRLAVYALRVFEARTEQALMPEGVGRGPDPLDRPVRVVVTHGRRSKRGRGR